MRLLSQPYQQPSRGGASNRHHEGVKLPEIPKRDLFNRIQDDGRPKILFDQLPPASKAMANTTFDKYALAIDEKRFHLRDLPIKGPLTNNLLSDFVKAQEKRVGVKKVDVDRAVTDWFKKNGILIKCAYCQAYDLNCSGGVPCTNCKAKNGRCPQNICRFDLNCEKITCPLIHSTLTEMVKRALKTEGLPDDHADKLIDRWVDRRHWEMAPEHYHTTFSAKHRPTDYPPTGSAIEQDLNHRGNHTSIPRSAVGSFKTKWTLALVDDRDFDQWLRDQKSKANRKALDSNKSKTDDALQHRKPERPNHPHNWFLGHCNLNKMGFTSWDEVKANAPDIYADCVERFHEMQAGLMPGDVPPAAPPAVDPAVAEAEGKLKDLALNNTKPSTEEAKTAAAAQRPAPEDGVAKWQGAANTLPQEYKDKTDQPPPPKGSPSAPRDDKIKEQFRKTQGPLDGKLGGPRHITSTEKVIHDGSGTRDWDEEVEAEAEAKAAANTKPPAGEESQQDSSEKGEEKGKGEGGEGGVEEKREGGAE